MIRENRNVPPLKPQDILRFWSKVRIRGPDECWPWTGGRTRQGYGRFRCGSTIGGSRGMVSAQRISFICANGPFPTRLCICHICDNPPCCNPAHLFLGTQLDNQRDKARKGRAARGEKNGAHTHPESRPRGERQGLAQLSTGQVLQIRAKYALGNSSQRALARIYRVAKSTIGYIARRETWQHL